MDAVQALLCRTNLAPPLLMTPVRIGRAGHRGVPVRRRAALASAESSETASEKISVLAICVLAKAFSMMLA